MGKIVTLRASLTKEEKSNPLHWLQQWKNNHAYVAYRKKEQEIRVMLWRKLAIESRPGENLDEVVNKLVKDILRKQ